MNRKISTPLSITLILICAALVSGYALTKSRSINYPAIGQSPVSTSDSTEKTTACRNHIFQGSAKLHVWKTTKDGKDILRVAPNEIASLPAKDINEFQLIDPTPEIAKKLTSSSEEKPVEILLSGFATECNGTALACLSYRDKVFQTYLTN